MTKYISSNPKIIGGKPVIVGTRIPISRIIFLLKQGYPLEAIHDDYPWVDIKTLEGAIDEVVDVINQTLHAKKFYKHKLLFDENMPPRQDFRRLNNLFDIKHIVMDLKKSGVEDYQVYDEAIKMKRLIVTLNGDDFKDFVTISKKTGVIALSGNLLKTQIDKKLTAFLIKSSGKVLLGKFTPITGET